MSTATALKLQDAGFNRQQVDALVELVEKETVTKVDLVSTEATLKAEIAAVKADVASAARVTHALLGVGLAMMAAIGLRVFFG